MLPLAATIPLTVPLAGLPIGWLLVLLLCIPAIWLTVSFMLFHARKKKNEAVRKDRPAGLNRPEALRQMSVTGRNHAADQRKRSSTIRNLHWSTYLGLQIVRIRLGRAPAAIIAMIPASLWLFDNFYLLYREIKKFQETGGSFRYTRLPVVRSGAGKGQPRAYVLARTMLSVCNRHLDEETIASMLMAYQEERELTTAELWAFQNMLSMVMLEEIIIETGRLGTVIKAKKKAEIRIRNLTGRILQRQEQIPALLAEAITRKEMRDLSFLAHIILRLRNLSVDDQEIEAWLDRQAPEGQNGHGRTLAGIISAEGQQEAEAEAVISALVTSLKAVSDLNWEEVFEKTSRLDDTLSQDPAGMYADMREDTKSSYRLVVEKLARRSGLLESAVAAKTVALAHEQADHAEPAKRAHVGYYLLDEGYYELVRQVTGRKTWLRLLRQTGRLLGKIMYFFILSSVTALFLYLINTVVLKSAEVGPAAKAILLLFTIIPASDAAICLANSLSTQLVRPKSLPAMNYDKQIPPDCRTAIVMPVIIHEPQQFDRYAQQLEKHYLANRQQHLLFALLADYFDAPARDMPEDQAILEAGMAAVRSLNQKYSQSPPRFLLFFRPRKWNAAQNHWMGWERKRGKLETFNALLTGQAAADMTCMVGDEAALAGIRYVITLDADTELLREGASQLIGIMNHPLNRPVYSSSKKRITDGYVIVQSEIRARLTSGTSSLFARFFSGQAGLDPYATRVSDVYQDLFDEGIYAGKGIYDVQVFCRYLGGAIPENSVLSHDLLEGSLSRCAFASGVKLMDSCPGTVAAFTRREHRWIRGDWQLLPWIFSWSSINGLSRWKMVDNLRRSLSRPALLLLVVANALLLPQHSWIWMLFWLFDPAWRMLVLLLSVIWKKLTNPTARLAKLAILEQLTTIAMQTALGFFLLPYRAFIAMDAVLRTLYRLLISHKNLLEWQTAEQVDKNTLDTPGFYWRLMWPSLLPAAALAYAGLSRPGLPAAPVWLSAAFAWGISPWLACWCSRLRRAVRRRRTDGDRAAALRLTARSTWRFFEDYMSVDTHWLCPDHLQEHPGPKVANKTSPTNIGLQLLAILSARDMGYISLHRFADTCENVIDTLLSMPKWKGHLYNWYNIRTLQVLNPRYVSTVDSGNLFAHLIVVRQGLLEQKNKPVISPASLEGLRDTCRLAGFPDSCLPDAANGASFRTSVESLLDRDLAEPDLHPGWLDKVDGTCHDLLADLDRLGLDGDAAQTETLQAIAQAGHEPARRLVRRIDGLAAALERLAAAADFSVLYDSRVQHFYIGYHVAAQQADSGHYDLLASEARLASFLAIARGDAPYKHWFALGRPLTMIRGVPACVSWSGSMFEYLMPNLVMKNPSGSVLQQSCLAAVLQQIKYARKNKLPWGISESQFYRFDTDANYQYGPFGVSKIRLQSSLRPAKVITPYATMLSLAVLPGKALANLSLLRSLGAEGDFGFYEALDYNQPDTGQFRPFSLVRSFMAHHQGMSLVAINNYLNQDIMPRRFHKEPVVRATEILLEEKRTSGIITLASLGYTISADVSEIDEEPVESRVCSQVNLERPLAHVLSNNTYMVLLSSDGTGYSCHDNCMISRWQPEKAVNQGGQFIYIRNTGTGQIWSTSYLPTQTSPDDYQVVFSHCEATYTRLDGFIQTQTRIAISPSDNVEIRKVTLSNFGSRDAVIELTSYLEVVGDSFLADALHPAFSKLFLETEFVASKNLLIARRRQREADDPSNMVMHTVLPETALLHPVTFETDRKSFIGRGGSPEEPAAICRGQPLGSKDGFSRDTILSLRAVVKVPAGQTAQVSFATGFFQQREDVLRMSYELGKPHSISDIFKLAVTRSKLELKYLNISSRQQNAILNLAASLFWPVRAGDADIEALSRLRLGQSSLWRFGISGDFPIMLLRAGHPRELTNIQEVLLSYEYLRLKKVKADLVIINEEPAGYAQELEHKIRALIASLKTFSHAENKPGIFLLQRANLSDDEYHLIRAMAKISLSGKTGLYAQYAKAAEARLEEDRHRSRDSVILLPPGRVIPEEEAGPKSDIPALETGDIEFFNGYGGFVNDGTEYLIVHGGEKVTPRPWINVIANEQFGFHISETGAGYTWAGNSRENKLTTWSNDPVLDPLSEAVYIRDEDDGGITSPAALNPGHAGLYQVRHGFGYSVFEHDELELEQVMTVFACRQDPVKIWLLEIKNNASRPRRLTATLFAEWVLGVTRHQEAPTICSDYDQTEEVFMAYNRYHDLYRDKPAFVFSSEPVRQYTGDRLSFYGTGGSGQYPLALSSREIPCKTGPGLDPCAVIQVSLQLDAHQSGRICFGLGQADAAHQAVALARTYRVLDKVLLELDDVRRTWQQKLRLITLHTPDRAMDILANGWLLYQVISCRLRAKAAFYQCGGAVGFRDQLQDVLSLLDTDPASARQQIIRCSARQFVEGDVQHWWHDSSNVGVRTRITDDLLWLPYVTAEYISRTGDDSILEVRAPFLRARSLTDKEAEAIIPTQESQEQETIYQHCVRAVDRAMRFGAHGLPLIGGGDWNDGMNRIGIEGRGESVWLGFFLYAVLQKFIPLARRQADAPLASQLTEAADSLQENINRHAWDGEWYLRAFFDDGSPVGSMTCDECRIDSISQSWSVLSQCAGRIRALTALDSARRHLVRTEDGLSLLLAPPFDKTSQTPGYIKGYYPGIRENGGQYTHGALWLAMAFSSMKNGQEAYRQLSMLNPIHAASGLQAVNKYENEPYVMSADISFGGSSTGKAGWSWYTGSASWMYQLIMHHFLGLNRSGEILRLEPSVPDAFQRYVIEYRHGSSLYEITVLRASGQAGPPQVTVDGKKTDSPGFTLVDDGQVHSVIYQW